MSTYEVHKLPMGEGLYALAAAAKRCHAKSDVEDYVITYDEWPEMLDACLCQLRKSNLLVLESSEECAERVAQEKEGAGAQAEQQSARASVRASPQSLTRSAASTSSLFFVGVQAADSVEEWDARGYQERGVD